MRPGRLLAVAVAVATLAGPARAAVPANVVHCAIVVPAYNLAIWDEGHELYTTHYRDMGDRIVYRGSVPPQVRTLVERTAARYLETTKVRIWGCQTIGTLREKALIDTLSKQLAARRSKP